ncbi:MAG: sodium transporter, partial [Bacteroidota bacterium]
SLSSAFNSSSTLLTIDFYQKFRPNASEKDLVRFGRLATVILVVLSLGWIPFMDALMGGGIFHYLQSVQAYISPPIAAVFLLGLFFKWINARGAIVALWTGFGIGVLRLVLEFMNNNGSIVIAKDGALAYFLGINFLHFAFFLFLFCALVLMLVSKMSKPQPPESLELVTFQGTSGSFRWSTDVVLSVILVALVLILWWVFSPLGVG